MLGNSSPVAQAEAEAIILSKESVWTKLSKLSFDCPDSKKDSSVQTLLSSSFSHLHFQQNTLWKKQEEINKSADYQ